MTNKFYSVSKIIIVFVLVILQIVGDILGFNSVTLTGMIFGIAIIQSLQIFDFEQKVK